MLDYIRRQAPNHSHRHIADDLSCMTGLEITEGMVRSTTKRYKIKGRDCRFRHGSIPANKGLSIPSHTNSVATQFKKGSKPTTWLPIGSERIADGYVQVKMTDTGYPPRDWVAKHRLIWEAHNGPLPDKTMLRFIDGDRTNIRLDNLLAVTRQENAVMNRWLRVNDMPEGGLISLHLMAKIKIKASQRKKEFS